MAYGRKRYSHSGATTSTKPIIFWDAARLRYVIKTPYSDFFKNSLLTVCHSATYLGASEKAWSIQEDDLAAAKLTVQATFGEFDFIEKPSSEHTIVHTNGTQGAALRLLTIDGYDGAKRVYSMLIKQYHPDTNKSPEASAKAAEITTAWRDFKREMGWS